jgi:hypothetical protein
MASDYCNFALIDSQLNNRRSLHSTTSIESGGSGLRFSTSYIGGWEQDEVSLHWKDCWYFRKADEEKDKATRIRQEWIRSRSGYWGFTDILKLVSFMPSRQFPPAPLCNRLFYQLFFLIFLIEADTGTTIDAVYVGAIEKRRYFFPGWRERLNFPIGPIYKHPETCIILPNHNVMQSAPALLCVISCCNLLILFIKRV